MPFGLVRYGVSPLHADVKNVTHTFSHTARNDNYRFIGNVKVGKDIQLKELLSRYHAVVLAYGSHLEKKLGIPGEDSQNVISSNEFVAWYNGHPDAGDISPNFQTESAVLYLIL